MKSYDLELELGTTGQNPEFKILDCQNPKSCVSVYFGKSGDPFIYVKGPSA